MPKIVDSEEYRKELLHRCFDLFAERGYANVTTRQISKELGISTGAMYHYFPSKQALFEQLMEVISQQDVQLLRSIAQSGSLTDRLERLGALLIEHEKHFVQQAIVWTEFYQQNALSEINNNPAFVQIDQRYQTAMEQLLNLSDPKLARFIWTLINGILIEQVETEAGFSFSEQVQLLTQMLIAYCEKYRQ